MKVILSVSADRDALETRKLVLERTGCNVTSVVGTEEARKAMAIGRCDLVVLGHSLSVEDRRTLIKALKQDRQVPVIEVLRNASEASGMADRVVEIFAPERLVQTASSLVDSNNRRLQWRP